MIPFVKASACGNDFLLIDSSVLDNSDPAQIAALTRRICDRHNGVGGDGVEWMYSHVSADVEIRLINADGSAAEISGNGTRCVAAYISASQEKDRITIQTGAGPKLCTLISRSQSNYEFEIEMGEAFVGAELTLRTTAQEIRGIRVSMGNPHFVVFMPALFENWKLRAAEIQRSPGFEHGINIEFVVIDGQHDVTVRFFERGVGETQSSGTGSCASAIAAIAAGKAKSPVRVHTLGGTQTVRQENNAVFLRGTARLVCRGEFFES